MTATTLLQCLCWLADHSRLSSFRALLLTLLRHRHRKSSRVWRLLALDTSCYPPAVRRLPARSPWCSDALGEQRSSRRFESAFDCHPSRIQTPVSSNWNRRSSATHHGAWHLAERSQVPPEAAVVRG